MAPTTDDEFLESRQEYLDRLLDSDSPRKVVVAGPGTGKTYAFGQVLARVGGSALVLTFLNELVRDLERSFSAIASVYSFHGFASWLLHSRSAPGVTTRVAYYPPIDVLMVEDLRIVHDIPISPLALANLLRDLATDSRIDIALHSGSYYDAVGFDDSVYRVLGVLNRDPSAIPLYDQILVDEFQDFCQLEVALIQVLASQSPVLIVGDDDQALYAFRRASPAAIRDLARDTSYERFELPYCTRCTEVLVAATQRVVEIATRHRLLRGRVPKQFICYAPAKRDASAAYPKIVHAKCSTQSAKSNYMGRYIEHQIRQIGEDDIASSYDGGYPTVLVIGPNPFRRQVEAYLRERFVEVHGREQRDHEPDRLDAYPMLTADPRSRLAWRILLHLYQPDGWEDCVRAALMDGVELADLVQRDFRRVHLRLAQQLDSARCGELPAGTTREMVAEELGIDVDDLPGPRSAPADLDDEEPDHTNPNIMFASLMGSKGLQAEHVFVIGVNGGYFPNDSDKPTDAEVCQLLVALTRARKSCTLVSTTRFAGERVDSSVFVDWLAPHLDSVYVNVKYLDVLT